MQELPLFGARTGWKPRQRPLCRRSLHAVVWITALFPILGCPAPVDLGNGNSNNSSNENSGGDPDGGSDGGMLPADLLVIPGAADTYSSRDIGSLGGPTTVLAISDLGDTAGYGVNPTGETRAFFWNRVSLKQLTSLSGRSSARGFALNAAGSVVGDSSDPSVAGTIFMGTSAEEVAGLAGEQTTIYGINSAGVMVGTSQAGTGEFRAIKVATDGTVNDLGVGAAYGIGDGGAIVGALNGRAFLIAADGEPAKDLGTLGGDTSVALAVNATGVAVGKAMDADGAERAFVYTNGAMYELGVLPGGRHSAALAINATNQIVGSATSEAGESRAVLFQNGTVIDLNSRLDVLDQQRFTLINATGVNARGYICCNTAEGKAVILRPERGADFLRYDLVDLGIPQSAGFEATCETAPEGHNPGRQDFVGRVHPETYGLTRNGLILLVGKILGYDGSLGQFVNPYYRMEAFGNPLQNYTHATAPYYRTLLYEAGVVRDLGIPPGVNHGFEAFNVPEHRYEPAKYLNFRAAVCSPNGAHLSGFSSNEAIANIRGNHIIYQDVLNIQGAVRTTNFVYHAGVFLEDNGREQIWAFNDAGQTCGLVRPTSSTTADGGASVDGRIIGPGVCLAINAFGALAGCDVPYPYTNGTAFLYASGAITKLDLGGNGGVAYDINNRGEVVGESKTADGQTHAFIYSNGRLSDLGVIEGGQWSSARAINDAGEVVGFATDASGVQHLVVFRDGRAVTVASRLADEEDRALGPFANFFGLDNDGNILVSKPLSATQNYVFLLERLR